MISKEEQKMRVQFLRDFDNYIRNEIGDDNITNIWLSCGVPDGADIIDLTEIAEEDELWKDCVECFANCCKAADII